MLALFLAMSDSEENREKVNEIYHYHGKMMKDYALRITKDEALADDAVQDAFMWILLHADEVRGVKGASVEAYLRCIVRSKAFNIIQREKRQENVLLDLSYFQPEFEEDFYSSLTIERVDRAIDALPEQYQDILELVVYHDLPIKEVAEVLELKYDATRKRLKRAVHALEKALEEEDALC